MGERSRAPGVDAGFWKEGPRARASGVSHTPVVLWGNQAQHFGAGTRLSVLGKAQDQVEGHCPWTWTLSLLPIPEEGG